MKYVNGGKVQPDNTSKGNNAQVDLTVHKYLEAKTTGCLPKGGNDHLLINRSCFP